VQSLFDRPTVAQMASAVAELLRLRERFTAKVAAPLGEMEQEGES
jgi:hypothetical protein